MGGGISFPRRSVLVPRREILKRRSGALGEEKVSERADEGDRSSPWRWDAIDGWKDEDGTCVGPSRRRCDRRQSRSRWAGLGRSTRGAMLGRVWRLRWKRSDRLDEERGN